MAGPAAANVTSPAAWNVLPCSAPFTFDGPDGTQVREVVRSPDAPYAFDNLWEGLLTVFVAASGEGWPSTMWRAQDITGDGLQPERRANPMFSLFWVALIVVLEWFLTQLFIGAVFEEFIKLKRREETGIAALSARQKQFLAGQRFLASLLPVHLFDDPDHACRQVVSLPLRRARCHRHQRGITAGVNARRAADVSLRPGHHRGRLRCHLRA